MKTYIRNFFAAFILAMSIENISHGKEPKEDESCPPSAPMLRESPRTAAIAHNGPGLLDGYEIDSEQQSQAELTRRSPASLLVMPTAPTNTHDNADR